MTKKATLACVPDKLFLLVFSAFNSLVACKPSNFGPSGPVSKVKKEKNKGKIQDSRCMSMSLSALLVKMNNAK